MKKDFDKLSVKQLKHIHSIFHQQQLSNREVTELIKSHNEVIEILSKTTPWSHFYELPYKTFLALYIVMFDLTEVIKTIAQADDQAQAFIDHFDAISDTTNEDNDEDLSDEDKGLGFSLAMALIRQHSSIAIHNQSLSQLVALAKEGNDNALFDAVLVDRSIVANPTIAYRIQAAQLVEDESFMASLSKAITKTRPRRPQKKYDDLRYMIEVIDEEIGLKNVTKEKIYNILTDELELYDGSTDGLEKIIQRRANKYRT